MGEHNAFHFAEGGDGGAIEDVVAIVEEDFGDADERGVEFIALQHFGEFGGRGENDFVLESARERDGVEIADGADAEGREGLFEVAFALAIGGALFVFDAAGEVFRGFAGRHAEFWCFVRHKNFTFPGALRRGEFIPRVARRLKILAE